MINQNKAGQEMILPESIYEPNYPLVCYKKRFSL